jgi:ABC-2 type transport system ATP-binding protein
MMRVAASPNAAPDAPATEVLRLDDVSMRFGDVNALRGANLSVLSGTILGIIGPSGAGKTTLIRILTGALQPSNGRARVLGEDPRRFRRRTRERIGYMPQQFTLYPDLTAKENVDFVASLFGLLWKRRWDRTRQVLETVDLWDARDRRASNMSGGMQRRLELACALVHDPRLYFLDEPTAGIDPLLRARIWEELHRLKDDGRTLLVTTQYVNEAEECDTVALIAEGTLIALAPPEELRRLATGGDVIEVETADKFDPATLRLDTEVRAVERITDFVFRAVVDDAGTALPAVLEAMNEPGVEVTASREYRISFDEVFAILVDRHRREHGPADGEDRDDRGDRDGDDGSTEWASTTLPASQVTPPARAPGDSPRGGAAGPGPTADRSRRERAVDPEGVPAGVGRPEPDR